MSGSDRWVAGTTCVYVEFDTRVDGVNPKTGEIVPPPYCMTITCPPDGVGRAESIVSWLIDRYGWSGDVRSDVMVGGK